MIVCVVGKSGSGKSYVCQLLQGFSENIIHLNIDKIAHDVLTDKNVYLQIIDTFGISVSNNNDISVNRRALSNIVFNSETEMDKLTKITWPPMQIRIDEFINEHPNKIILLDWQLLLKTKYYNLSDLKILVNSPIELRMKNAMLRDNITEKIFMTREQASFEFNSNDFDYIINNDYSDKVKEMVKEIYDKSIISR